MQELNVNRQLEVDLKATYDALDTKGWTTGRLVTWVKRAWAHFTNQEKDAASGPMCMTGAAGYAVEGFDFFDYILRQQDNSQGTSYGWSFRGVQVLKALVSNIPPKVQELMVDAGHSVPDQDYVETRYSASNCISTIIMINDSFLHDQRTALLWVETALQATRKKILEDEASVVKPAVFEPVAEIKLTQPKVRKVTVAAPTAKAEKVADKELA